MNADNAETTLLTFPCEFPIKAMGKTGPELEIAIREIFRRHVPEISEAAIDMVRSKNGTYTSITVTISAQSKQQLDNIYQDLTACQHVLYAL